MATPTHLPPWPPALPITTTTLASTTRTTSTRPAMLRESTKRRYAPVILQHAAAAFQTLLCLALFAATAQRIITYCQTNAMFVSGRLNEPWYLHSFTYT